MRTSTGGTRTEKIVFLGAQSTGKTAIVTRLQNNTFNANSNSTIGAAFNSKMIMVDNNQIKLDIWDTAGSEKYKSLTPMYYRDARAAIIVIDVTRPETLDAASEWLNELREHGKGDCIIVLAANKIDLESQRKISSEQVNEFAFTNQMQVTKETSALSGAGINELLTETARLLLKLPAVETQDENDINGLVGDIGGGDNPKPAGGGGCC